MPVGDNLPVKSQDADEAAILRHGERCRMSKLLIELRQETLATPIGARNLGGKVGTAVQRAIAARSFAGAASEICIVSA